MKRTSFVLPGLIVLFATLLSFTALAESHRATRLGSPSTRFAPPLHTPEDLRALFANLKLRPDFEAILKQWGWQGNIDDMFAAAATAEIQDTEVAVGATMPFMSSRRNGKPVCLRNVLWAGKKPAPAYAFNFTSDGRRYRCVTPKACSNFFLEDLGPEPRPALAVSCATPDEVPAGRPLEVCLVVRNTGNAPDPRVVISLAIPQGANVTRTTDGGSITNGILVWELAGLSPNTGKEVCATLATRELCLLPFTATASGTANSVQTSCETKVIGIPAILLEVVDVEDPIEVGKEVVYEIRVTNQGTAIGTNIRLSCMLPASQEFVSGTGTTAVQTKDGVITIEPLAALEPKSVASWRVVVKALQPDDARFEVVLASDQFTETIAEDESTRLY